MSVHPRFSHTAKRYTLGFVIKCLDFIIAQGKSIYEVSRMFVVYHKTLSHWVQGFRGHNINAKWACFFHGDLPRDEAGFAPALLRHFRSMGNGNLEDGTSAAMVCLHEGFSCRLY